MSITTTTVIGSDATWRFRSSPVAPSADWAKATYSDTAWRSGHAPFWHAAPLVGADLGTPRTVTYFRTTFTATDASQVTAASLTMRADDGAVAYLNGVEIGRVNLPDRPVTHATAATRSSAYQSRVALTYAAKPSAVVTGTNVLAIELHQGSDGSWVPGLETLTATLTLTIDTGTPPPPPPPAGQWVEHWSTLFGGTDLPAGMKRIVGPYGNPVGSGCRHVMLAGNLTVSGGYARVKALKQPTTYGGRTYEWTSGMADTRSLGLYFPRFLRVEVRALVPHTVGIWPGIWLRSIYGASKGEPDLMEAFEVALAGSVTQTLWLSRNGSPTTATKKTTVVSASWHTYTVQVVPTTPGAIASARFSMEIDGVETLSYVDTQAATWANVADPMKAWDFAFQIFVGGWGGTPAASLTSAEMLIDSVRVLVPSSGV